MNNTQYPSASPSPKAVPIQRCVNLDWLEVYCLEGSIGFPHNADYFRERGWHVQEREYGTPIYNEMFTLYGTDGLPLIEVRRAPKSSTLTNKRAILDPYSCHVRLCNRTCYMEDAAGIMQRFLEENFFCYSRISRLDICLDFEKFDSGDLPQDFLQRYVSGKFAKLNQARISVHGLDRWDGRRWNSCKWGSPTSMVSTKLYDKTMELEEVHDKPYIRQAWFAAGLIDDWFNCTTHDRQGRVYKPAVWRLEFSIKSSDKNWFVVEDVSGKRKKLRSIRHTLDNYHTRAQLLDVFSSLCSHYFHFKYVEFLTQANTQVAAYALNAIAPDVHHDLSHGDNRQRQRKDRCRDKVLFRFDKPSVFYKIARVATSDTSTKAPSKLLQLLYEHREKAIRPETFKACNYLIEELEYRLHTQEQHHWSRNELIILQQLLAKRIKDPTSDLHQDYETLRELLQLEDRIF